MDTPDFVGVDIHRGLTMGWTYGADDYIRRTFNASDLKLYSLYATAIFAAASFIEEITAEFSWDDIHREARRMALEKLLANGVSPTVSLARYSEEEYWQEFLPETKWRGHSAPLPKVDRKIVERMLESLGDVNIRLYMKLIQLFKIAEDFHTAVKDVGSFTLL